jgi:Flp pilus assembly protein TadD
LHISFFVLSVNYMMLAMPPNTDQGCLQAHESGEVNMEHLSKAIEFHRAHLQVSDLGGQFVAHSNLGLCYGMMHDWPQAGHHHQEALRIAIKLQTLYGQSIAVGNLGILAMTKGDTQTAKTCLEQHLQLVQTLQDVEAEVAAWELVRTGTSPKFFLI